MGYTTKILKNRKILPIILIFFMSFGLIAMPALNSSLSSLYSQPVSAQPAAGIGNQKPNFLVIVGDDFGYSDIGSFGSEISTPNLDAIAKDGKVLTDYHTAPTCSPARVALMTGVDWHVGGIGTMYELIADNQVGKARL